MECSHENLLNLVGLEAIIFSIFGMIIMNFKPAIVALTPAENILLANVFEIKNRLAKSSCNKPSLIFIKHNRNSSLPESYDFGPIFFGRIFETSNNTTFYTWTPPLPFTKGLIYSKNLSNNVLDLIPV